MLVPALFVAAIMSLSLPPSDGQMKLRSPLQCWAIVRYGKTTSFPIKSITDFSNSSMSFEELEKSVIDFIGKEVVLPFRTIAQHCRGDLNFICPSEGGKDKLIIAATNKAGTNIHAFEYVQLKGAFDLASHEGEEASISGTIASIQPNPNKSRFLVMRIYISN